jgi:hypothetical protein
MANRSAWPMQVQAVAELPPPLDAQLAELLLRGEQLQQLVYVPADPSASRRGSWQRTRGVQVLALSDRRLIVGIQAMPRGEAPWLAIPYDRLMTWEIGVTLLYGRLDIAGQLDTLARTYLEFNTVGLALIEAALAPLELHTLGLSRQVDRRARPQFPNDVKLPYKFGNFLADALLPGELVRSLVFQEAVVVPRFRFWRRLLAPGTLIAGTDRRLLVIREEANVRTDRYGHMALSMPRRWADRLVIQGDVDWLTVTYAPSPELLKLRIECIHAEALHTLLAALHPDSHTALAIEREIGTG